MAKQTQLRAEDLGYTLQLISSETLSTPNDVLLIAQSTLNSAQALNTVKHHLIVQLTSCGEVLETTRSEITEGKQDMIATEETVQTDIMG